MSRDLQGWLQEYKDASPRTKLAGGAIVMGMLVTSVLFKLRKRALKTADTGKAQPGLKPVSIAGETATRKACEHVPVPEQKEDLAADVIIRYAWRVHPKAGSIANLQYKPEILRAPSRGYVQVRVKSVGLNFADVFAVQGLYSATPQGNFIPGLEFAGIVTQIHTSEEGKPGGIKVGDYVMGATRFGGYTTDINAQLGCVRKLPQDWSFQQGSGFICQALTAFYALHALGALPVFKPEQKTKAPIVLVHSAAGGVGLNALAMCRVMGCEVIATIGAGHKVKHLMEQCGLDRQQIIVRDQAKFGSQLDAALEFLNARRTATETKRSDAEGQTVTETHAHAKLDIVLDSLSGPYLQPALQRLNPGGRHIIFGAGSLATPGNSPNWFKLAYRYLNRPVVDPMDLIAVNRSVMGFNLIWLWDDMQTINDLLDKMIQMDLPPPHVGHTYAMAQAPEALRCMLAGQTVGKVVLLND